MPLRMVPMSVLLVLLSLAGCVQSTPGSSSPDIPAPTQGPGSLVLFGGRTVGGWSQSGPGGFEVTGGVLRSTGGMGLFWYRARAFGDFVLDLDWRATADTDNSGVFLRFPTPADPGAAVRSGYEVQINDNPGGDPQKTGAIYGFQPAARAAPHPIGEWNHYTIQVIGNEYLVWLNNVLINRFTGTDPNRARKGHIGLQNHDAGSVVEFRDVRVHEVR
jgi:hypothetical protein